MLKKKRVIRDSAGLLSLMLMFIIFAGCQSDRKESKSSNLPADYAEKVKKFRKQRDNFFQNSEQSPLPQETRRSFQGLSYYPPDPSYRIKGAYSPYDEPEKRAGWMLAVGRFTFSLAGRELDLEIWSSKDSGDLSIMFTDPTNKKETYKAGRYVELKRSPEGSFILDFNYAYNPYCHYNPIYVCPIPPPENHIPVAVKAGEKRLAQ